MLKADVILVSDTSMLWCRPAFTDHRTARTGLLGNRSDRPQPRPTQRSLRRCCCQPINVLCQIISQVTDAEGRITVPGFLTMWKKFPKPSAMIARIPFDEEKYKKAIHVKALSEKGYSTLERNSCRPSFDVCGIWGGYTGEGPRPCSHPRHTPGILPVGSPPGPPQDIPALCRLHSGHSAGFSTGKVTPMHGGQGYVCPITLPAYQAAEKGFEKLLERNRWQCVGVEVSPSSPLSSKYWASKPF